MVLEKFQALTRYTQACLIFKQTGWEAAWYLWKVFVSKPSKQQINKEKQRVHWENIKCSVDNDGKTGEWDIHMSKHLRIPADKKANNFQGSKNQGILPKAQAQLDESSHFQLCHSVSDPQFRDEAYQLTSSAWVGEAGLSIGTWTP